MKVQSRSESARCRERDDIVPCVLRNYTEEMLETAGMQQDPPYFEILIVNCAIIRGLCATSFLYLRRRNVRLMKGGESW